MDIAAITSNISGFTPEKTISSYNETAGTTAKSFEDFYSAAMGLFEDTNKKELEVEQLQRDFATGKTDDYLGLMIAQEEAYTTLQFTVQVTNKVIDAYKEIMRIQL